MGVKVLILVTMCCLPPLVFGQEDSTYIKKFPEKITIRALGRRISNSYRLSSLNDDATLLLKPNARDKIGLSAQYRSVEIGFGFTPRFLWRNKQLEKSRLVLANLRLYLGRWIKQIEVYYQRGFFGQIEGVELAYPNFKTTKIGGSTAFSFNRNFSFRALTSQHEWQKKSAGSFVPRLFYYYTHFNWDYDDFGFDTHSYDLAIGPGYHYNWVIQKNLMLSAGANTAAGLNISNSDDDTLTSFLYEGGLRLAFGYNSDNFFTGFDCNLRVFEHNERRDVRVDDRITTIEFYVGYRLDAPKKLLKLSDKINAKLPL
jgi:hypothetical protein